MVTVGLALPTKPPDSGVPMTAWSTREPGLSGKAPNAPELRQVLIATEPVAAQIFIGTEPLGMTPVSVPVPEGQNVELAVRADGFKESRFLIDGTVARLSVTLERIAVSDKLAAPGSKRSVMRLRSEIIDPWSK